jgi:predicted nucleotidyltransferase
MISEKKYGLSIQNLNAIIEVISSFEGVESIILFGSRVLKNFKPGSDIDIALKGDSINLDDILRISLALDELMLPYKFDLIIYSRITEPALKEHIDQNGVVL